VPPSLTPPLPTEIQVEVTGACNLACKMCLVRYRPKLGRAEGAMSFEMFRNVVDSLPELNKITLQGLGEPLLAPDLFRMIEYAAGRGISMGFNTNGTFLDPLRAERLVHAGLAWLNVSVDGATPETYEAIRHGSSFERVRSNVVGLTDVLRRLDATAPTVSLVFVAMRRNVRELPDLVRLASAWGVGRLFVQNLSHSFGDTDPAGAYAEIRSFADAEALWGERDRDTAEAAFAEARAVAAELGVELRLPRLEEPPPEPREPGTPGCHWPFESAFVNHDGRVQPCCMVMGADRAVLGSVRDDGLERVWRGKAYRSFRRRLLDDEHPPDVCVGCALYRRVF
jgi:radical SAM protein with 4Fe4S-binding SPASM domain